MVTAKATMWIQLRPSARRSPASSELASISTMSTA